MVRISKIHLAFSNIYFCQFKVVTRLGVPSPTKPLLHPIPSSFFPFFILQWFVKDGQLSKERACQLDGILKDI